MKLITCINIVNKWNEYLLSREDQLLVCVKWGLFCTVFIKFHYMFLHSGRQNNFNKKTIQQVTGLGLPYDYDGVMHYGAYAFAIDRSKPTIVKLKNTGGHIGQRKGFSSTDLKQINILYDCKSTYLPLCSL